MTPRLGSDEAHALHVEAPPIDLHADPLLWSRFFGYDLLARHEPPFPRAALGGHVDLPRLREGGMGGQFFGLVALPGIDVDYGAICHAQIDALEEAVARSAGGLRIARSKEDLEEARRSGHVGALLGIEGAHALGGRIEALERFAARGVRYLGLVHFTENECGAPAYGWGARADAPLTRFGHAVVEACEALGVIVDLAHINARGFHDACAIARRPPIVSHTGVSGAYTMWRNIDDAQLRAVADKGGVVGVIFCPRYLGRDGVEAVVDHLMHIVKVAGEDAPALGSDWDGFIVPTRGLEAPDKLPTLTDALLARGLSREAVAKILRGNVLRVLEAAPPRATP